MSIKPLENPNVPLHLRVAAADAALAYANAMTVLELASGAYLVQKGNRPNEDYKEATKAFADAERDLAQACTAIAETLK